MAEQHTATIAPETMAELERQVVSQRLQNKKQQVHVQRPFTWQSVSAQCDSKRPTSAQSLLHKTNQDTDEVHVMQELGLLERRSIKNSVPYVPWSVCNQSVMRNSNSQQYTSKAAATPPLPIRDDSMALKFHVQ